MAASSKKHCLRGPPDHDLLSKILLLGYGHLWQRELLFTGRNAKNVYSDDSLRMNRPLGMLSILKKKSTNPKQNTLLPQTFYPMRRFCASVPMALAHRAAFVQRQARWVTRALVR